MTLVLLLVMVGALLLIWKGSDWLTDSLVPVAKKIGTSYIAVTTLLVSFMLSIPEIFTSLYSTLLGHVNIGLGVIIGSVMVNIGLTVGLSASIKPLTVEKSSVIRDGIFLVVACIVVLVFGSDLQYERSEGIVLLLLFVPYALNVWHFEKWRPKTSRTKKVEKMSKTLHLISSVPIHLKASILTFLLGGVMLIGGSYLFSYSLIGLNDIFGFPELLVGITIGALGPAMPNIAAAIQATRKGYDDAALTETFGSNIFTLLITLGIIVVLSPLTISGRVFYFDLTWMIIIHVLLIAFILKGYHYREEAITRYEGIALVLFYLVLLGVHVLVF